MNFKQLKNKIKEEQKALAKEIRELKNKRKHVPCGYVSGLDSKRWYYRHKHIAYCQFFNMTPYGLIEDHCNEEPSTSTIERYMKEWTNELETEDVRNCA